MLRLDRGIEIDKGTNWQEPDSQCHITIPQNNVNKVDLSECQSSTVMMPNIKIGNYGCFTKSKVSEVKNENNDSTKDEASNDIDRTSFTLQLVSVIDAVTMDSRVKDQRRLRHAKGL
jgi:hypothetical protein